MEAKARAMIAVMLDDGVPSVSQVAAASGLSQRTFQRRLSEEGTSFSALLEDVRRDQALTRLAAREHRLARVVECRFFGGLTDAETGTALGVTERTVQRDCNKSRLYLRHTLHDD